MQLEAGLPAGSSKDGVTEPPSDELLDEIVASAARLCDAPGAFLQWEVGEQGRREIRHGFEAVGAVDAPFRASVALTDADGQPLGELGVLDLRPREDGDRAARIIRELAPVAARAIEAQWKAQRLMEEIEAEHRQAESLLAQSQARLRAIIDTEPECVKVVSDEGILLDMNAAGLRIIGAGSDVEAIGMPVIRLIHPEDRQAFMDLHQRALGGDTGQLEFRLRALDGAERWLASHSTPLRGDDGAPNAVLSVTRDVTAQKQADRQRALETEILELITAGPPLSEVLEGVARAIDRAVPGVMSSILLANEDGTQLAPGAGPNIPPEFLQALGSVRIGPSSGACGSAAYRREPVVVEDLSTDPLCEGFRELASTFGLGACWSAPAIGASGEVIATFALYFSRPRKPTDAELQFLLRMAHLVGLSIDRSQAMEEVRRSRMLLDMASKLARLGAWLIMVSDGRLTWSDELYALHEVEPDFVLTLESTLAFYTPEHRERLRKAVEGCLRTGEPYDLEAELVTAKGRRLWVRTNGKAERDPSGKIRSVHGAFQDITERKSALETQQQQGWLLEIAGEVARIGGWTIDLPDMRVAVSKTVYGILGLPADYPLSLEEGVSYYRPGSRERLEAALAECLRGGSAFDLELEIVNNAGAPLWIRVLGAAERDDDGRILRARGAVQDITDRKEAEHELAEREERFRLVAKVTSDVVWDWDLVRNTVWWNEGRSAAFGHGPEDITDGPESWTDFIHPEDAQRVLDGIYDVIDGDGESWEDEYRFRRSDGEYAWVADRGYVIRDVSGKAVRMTGSMNDQTEKRRLEAMYRQSQRLEAVGQLTGGVAHDFNNLLTVILGNAELLKAQLERDPPLRRLAETTQQAAEQGAGLTHRLLAFARRQPLDPKPTDINRLLVGMDSLLRRTLGEDIEIEMVHGGGVWRSNIDASQLESGILNLCINARDAMPNGGKLTLETANAHLDDDYAALHGEVQPGQYVAISVTDTGSGMAPEIVGKAFEPFFTTKESGKGSGLGLSMVYGFVKQSNGHVKIYSEPGLGTSVRLYLPRERAEKELGAEEPRPVAPTGGREKILVVEDDDLVRNLVVEQLEFLGYEVVWAASGPEALERLKQHADIDLLFTDVVMPGGMSGRVLANEAKEMRPDLPVLYTSGYTENAIVHHGRLDPGVQLLQKPYRRQDLARKIRQAIDGADRRRAS